MFSQTCVTNSVHGGGEEGVCLRVDWGSHPPWQTPLLRADTHRPWADTPLGRHTKYILVVCCAVGHDFTMLCALVSSDRVLIVRLICLLQHRRKMRDCLLQRVSVVIDTVLS